MISRRFTIVTVALVAVVAFLVGAIVAGGFKQPALTADAPANIGPASRGRTAPVGGPIGTPLVNFADVVERINPAVVNIDATTRGAADRRRRRSTAPEAPEPLDRPDLNLP